MKKEATLFLKIGDKLSRPWRICSESRREYSILAHLLGELARACERLPSPHSLDGTLIHRAFSEYGK